MRRKKTARKAPRRAAKKSTRRKRSSSKKLSRVSVISDILSSEYGVSSEPEPAPKKKSSKKKSSKKKLSKKKVAKKVAKKGATPKKSGKMTYKDFVKEEFPKVQAEMPKGTPFITITKEVANRWRKYKEVFV